MNDLYIKVKGDAGYQRPSDWMTMPTVTENDNIFYGLFIVFENEYNQLTFRAVDNNNITIDWGDGSTPISADGTIQSKVYNFNQTMPNNTIYQWEDGRNYKQVMVTITPNDINTNRITFTNNSGINNNGNTNFVDIVCAFKDNNTRISLSNTDARRCRLLKIFKCLNTGTSNFFFDTSGFQGLDVEVFEFPNGDLIGTSSSFQNSTLRGEFRDLTADSGSNNFRGCYFNNPIRDIIGTQATFLFGSYIPSCRNVLNVSGLDSMWGADIDILGNVTITTTNFRRMFQGCTTRRLNVISMPSTPISVGSLGGAFSNMRNLQEMVLPGFRIGFDISNSNMLADALDALFTSLGTADGAQTIVVTGNPGASTCDTSIATAKGFTVII